MNKSLLTIKNLYLQAGKRHLIEDGDFTICRGEKIGLLGRNGSGKSTLFETIYNSWIGNQPPSYLEKTGQTIFTKGVELAYFPQSIKLNTSESVDQYLSRVSVKYKTLQKTENGTRDDSDMSNQMQKNIWSSKGLIETTLDSLDLKKHLNVSIGRLSGGEAAKVALAGIVLSNANLVLLDEPTNNLDARGLSFLERWLSDYKGSLLITSHDRDFLDRIVTKIIEIDEHHKNINEYGGNYSFYRIKKEEEFESQLKKYDEEKSKRKQLGDESKRLKTKAQKFEDLSTNSFKRTRGAKIAKRAKTQLKRIERDYSKTEIPIKPKRPSLQIPDITPNRGLLVTITDVSFSYDKDHPLLKKINLKIYQGDRITIIGPNGCGKTTLLNLITKKNQPNSGTVTLSTRLNVGCLAQYDDSFSSDKLVKEFVKSQEANIDDEYMRENLGYLFFRDIRKDKINSLSLGEIQRIQLFAMFAKKPNLIILDEPTNHLDLYTLELLEKILQTYTGAIVTVSHDRRFLKNIDIGSIYSISNGTLNKKLITARSDINKLFKME